MAEGEDRRVRECCAEHEADQRTDQREGHDLRQRGPEHKVARRAEAFERRDPHDLLVGEGARGIGDASLGTANLIFL
ncbi:MAG TPA: hypothetical protein PKW21_04160, partial [Rhabdaerophilum sp.]|nr:hypothetical protein [Rhabdaerophilum sp.]